ncbi:MAG: hypothetical protein JSW51_14675 [Gemmatimonadota bacterium]|nr:MAG: hypothetical protein JSW51_14675 [Gemmatimonadota bacterium]
MRQLNFRLPDPDPPQPAWGIVGLVINLVVFLLLAGTVGRTVVNRAVVQTYDLGPGLSGIREIELPVYERPGVVADLPPLQTEPGTEPADTAPGGTITVVYAPRVVPIGIPPTIKGLDRYDPVIGTATRIGVSRGSGNVWVRPMEGRIGVIGPSPDIATHVARVDSAVRAKIMAFIDTMPIDSFATPPMVTPWVTETEDGKTWGVDPAWIYLGDFKIPSALMALIPLPQGNIELAQQEAELMRIREEIMFAAQQAQNNEDFRRYVKEIRKRKDAEREERRRIAEEARRGAKKDTIKPIIPRL